MSRSLQRIWIRALTFTMIILTTGGLLLGSVMAGMRSARPSGAWAEVPYTGSLDYRRHIVSSVPRLTQSFVSNALGGATRPFALGSGNGFGISSTLESVEKNVREGFNDAFDNAADLAFPGKTPFRVVSRTSTHSATMEPNEPKHCYSIGATVWYKFHAPGDLALTLDTGGSNFPVSLAVYRSSASGLGGLTGLHCSTNAYVFGYGSGSDPITFKANAGDTYYFQVGGYAEATGSLVLQLIGSAVPAKPANDRLGRAHRIESLPFTSEARTLLADDFDESPDCAISHSVWFTYRESSKTFSSLLAAVAGEPHLRIRVFTGPDAPASRSHLTEIDCEDGWVEVGTLPGTRYFFEVGSAGKDSPGGSISFQLTRPDPPPNDRLRNAAPIVMKDSSYWDFEDVGTATLDESEPRPSCASPKQTVWYRLAADKDEVLEAQIQAWNYQSGYRGAALAVYEGESPKDLREVACAFSLDAGPEPQVELLTRAGSTYWFQAGSTEAPLGLISFDVWRPTPYSTQ